MMKKNYFLTLMIYLLYLSNNIYAQTNVDVANATLVSSFPYVEENFNSANGGSAAGMVGTCHTLPCCSTMVYKVILPLEGSLRAEFDQFTPLAGTIIAYTANVANPTTYSDLTYYSTPGNFCGFRDTLQLGRGVIWYAPGNSPDRSEWAPDPSSVYHYSVPAGTYYLLVFNENQQSGSGVGDNFKLTIRYQPLCPNTATCTSVNEVICSDAGYTAPSGQHFSASGNYTDTLFGGAQGGLDSISFISLAIQNTLVTQDMLPDTSLCEDDTLRQAAIVNYVSYLDFDGSTEYVDMDAVATDLAGSNRSAFMWIKKGTAVSGSAQVLMAINNSTGSGNISHLQIGTSQELEIYDGSNTQSTGVTVTDGLWHYVGYTYDDATDETHVYIDGSLVLTFTNSQSATSTSKYSLGQEFDSGLAISNLYSGLMSEVSIWKTVLSASDIALAMNAVIENSHPQYAHLLAYYPGWIDCEDDQSVLKDYSSNGNDGAASGSGIIQTDAFEQISNFNSAAWYAKEWSSTNLGSDFSTADSIGFELTTTDDFTLVLKRDFIIITETWTVAPQPSTQPEIKVKGNNENIENGDITADTSDYTNYGNIVVGSGNISRTFTIKNQGNIDLDISNVSIVGTDAADFSITTSPASTLSAGASTSLIIEFTPSSIGLKTATVEIFNSDCDEETFTFNIQTAVLGVDISDKRGNMFEFDGVDDYINIDNVSTNTDGATEFTFEAWINVDADQVGNDRIISVNTSSGGNEILFYLDDGKLETYDGANDAYGSPDIRGTGWHHVVLTHDNSSHRVYLDGELLNTRSGGVAAFTTSHKWSIGQEYDGASTGDYFKGKMDEVRIWRDVRTQAEIREKMHLTFSSEEILSMTNLVAYYQFDNDESAETTDGVKDIMGGHGTSIGGAYGNSEVAVGYGKSATQTVNADGSFVFADTDISLLFTSAGGESLPNGDIVVTKIVTEKPKNVSVNEMLNKPEVYWVINNYGTNSNLGATVKINFEDGAIDDDITTNHSIHKRASNDFETADWEDIEPDSVSSLNGGNNITATVSSFSQFAASSSTSDFQPTSLPIELLNFDARRKGQEKVKLTWQTATETNNQGFYIERSEDARKDFQSIAWVNGKGTSPSFSYYNYTDTNDFSGTSYYRLRQVDFNGATSYSEIRAVSGVASNELTVNIYPNPTENDLKIKFGSLPPAINSARIKILNTTGQVVASQTVSIATNQIVDLESVHQLVPSIYFIVIEINDRESILQRFVKR